MKLSYTMLTLAALSILSGLCSAQWTLTDVCKNPYNGCYYTPDCDHSSGGYCQRVDDVSVSFDRFENLSTRLGHCQMDYSGPACDPNDHNEACQTSFKVLDPVNGKCGNEVCFLIVYSDGCRTFDGP
jgi:hypothetical protein